MRGCAINFELFRTFSGDDECYTDEDCPANLFCFEPFGTYKSSLGSAFSGSDPLNEFPLFTKNQLKRKCIFRYGSGIEPQTGGGLKSAPPWVPGKSEYMDHYYTTFGRRNRIHAGFHPHYIKFVEDAMLVLFLLCVMVTLLVVHRASCHR